MGKTFSGIVITILVTGFIAGIFFGVELKTGEDVDPTIIMINIGKLICNAVPPVPNSPITTECNLTFSILLIGAIIAGIMEILFTANKIGDWRIGLFIYAVGFVVGIAAIY